MKIQEMYAIVANSRAVTEKKIKPSLAERLLQENDGPQPGDVGKGCDRWNHKYVSLGMLFQQLH